MKLLNFSNSLSFKSFTESFLTRMILIFCVIPVFVLSQTDDINQPLKTVGLSIDQIKSDMHAGLEYLRLSQQKFTDGTKYYKGEWPIYIYLRKPFKLQGRSRFYDSNSFGVIPIHNSLSEIYLQYPEYDSIVTMLEKSMRHIRTFMTDSSQTFGFWQSLPPGKKLSRHVKQDWQVLIKRPNHFPLRTKFTNNFVNVFDDSDDQALAFQSMLHYNQVMELAGLPDQIMEIPDSIPLFFEKYRDINRSNILFYNLKNGTGFNTGAFLTWFGNEYAFKNPKGMLYYLNNLFWYLPISCLHTDDYLPHIPFATNDVDVVVNANILTTLADFNLLDSTEGVAEAFELIDKKIIEEDFQKASMYYPNRYQLHYAVSRIFEASHGEYPGESSKWLIADLKSTQNEDGSWTCKRKSREDDNIQSTVNALLALLNFDDYEKNNTIENIHKAVVFLHQKATRKDSLIYWKGGVFFCGGMHIRYVVSWKSDAYTTALVLEAFAKYRTILEQKSNIILPLTDFIQN